MVVALRRLPARQRAAVVLRHYEDLSEAETARQLGRTAGTVRSLTTFHPRSWYLPQLPFRVLDYSDNPPRPQRSWPASRSANPRPPLGLAGLPARPRGGVMPPATRTRRGQLAPKSMGWRFRTQSSGRGPADE
nr:sigma factor-like helix-turn-helix DNA-binding protein [Pseudofrankia sp. DC12]